ncbi:monovalent cation/H+ antiporter subunit D family protein [Nisaea acidiphila]|uniref:Monovalent cation/H+ antiporter subunit D family protein n=1 Tax=Nisaea acidiphila TaxID=1862145 RepID=A0A9J7AX45_9PROT|nr:monovalent cation/H+ antiporter subunit D family protein [Nisaea acidiphila]UUX50029.1 monovalent cation/H+ antiporter subunit D family protein [Nisaea acidiphila]
MSAETAILATLFLPLVGMMLIALTGKSPNLREAVTLVTAVALFAIVLSLLSDVLDGARPSIDLIEVMPGLSLSFEVEPLGMLFACIASGLWIVNSLYSIGYMRGNGEKKQTRFYMCFTVAISSAMGIAFAGNMFTLFVFYEVLTLSTYPLVAHKETEEAKRGARIYLGILIGTSIGLQLAAIIWTWIAAGTLDFTAGGILSGKVDPVLLPFLLALYMFGIGKAALMPFHRWLPSAMVAPTPVSALLHAVAVVKAGVFTVLKVVVYIFGIDFLAETGASNWLIWVASFTLLAASLVAMSKDNLKARLAYSTISQLAYIVLGAALANHYAILGGALHIATHAFGKITLFMCAGAIYVATHKTEISDMQGLGRKMPFTFAAFCIGAFSIIGLPPLAGTWSKWYLALGAAETGMLIVVGVYMVSSLLNIAYLMPIVAKGFFRPAPGLATASAGAAVAPSKSGIQEAPLLCVLPPCLTAFGCFVLFFYADAIIALLRLIVE